MILWCPCLARDRSSICVARAGGVTRMDEDLPLRRRVPGAAGREAPASARPVLAESVLLRMQPAIDAAKTDLEEQDRDPITEPIPSISASRAKGAKGAKAPGPAAPGA